MDSKSNKAEINSSISGFWAEKVYVVTSDFEIEGFVFMPKTGKKNRILSEILNGSKRFVAIKDAKMVNRKTPDKEEFYPFIQLNLDSVIVLRLADNED